MSAPVQTDITIVLDRSGSMGNVIGATIRGFNGFLADQRKLPGAACLTLVQFDDQYEVTYEAIPLDEAPELDYKTFQPRGSTGLLDAIGKTIRATNTRLHALPAGQAPPQVILVILTDGQENSSREFARALVSDMIKHQQQAHGWQFVFLGANQDAVTEARTLGISAGAAMTFSSDKRGALAAFAAVSRGMESYRKSGQKQLPGWYESDTSSGAAK